MKPLKLKLVKKIQTVKKRGQAIVVNGHGGRKQLIICCPGCGRVSGSAGKHVFNEETLTYHPSIVHNEKLGGCGWHGWLKNGIFTDA